ncbi:MAG: hypothetical protein Q4G43_15805, partial [Mobilicoccus sp.]|nr:hypothetical protein [Mobilicoccus sp.]
QQRLDNVDAGRPADWAPGADDDPHHLYSDADAAPSPSGLPEPARRRHSVRAWLGIAVGCGLAGTALALAAASGIHVNGLAWASAILLVLGVALVWLARPGSGPWGRPMLLLPLSLILALAIVPHIVLAQVRPTSALTTAIDSSPAERLAPGDHTLDLSVREPSDETL